MEKRSRYYSPDGRRRENIKQEIVDAIHLNPTQDPSKTVAETRGEVVDTYDHLDIVIPLTEMAREKEITYDPKLGWGTKLPSSTEIVLAQSQQSDIIS